jgi:hypothetical protein
VEHPIYDIWLTDCKGGQVAEAPVEPAQPQRPAARPPQQQQRPAAQQQQPQRRPPQQQPF